MKTNYRRRIVVAACAFMLAFAASRTGAQVPKYKEGDRVEVDSIEASNPANAIWKKGVVTKVDLSSVAYIIQLDPLPGQLPKMMSIPIRPYAEGWIRPGGGAAPQFAQSEGELTDLLMSVPDRLDGDQHGHFFVDQSAVRLSI